MFEGAVIGGLMSIAIILIFISIQLDTVCTKLSLMRFDIKETKVNVKDIRDKR